MIGKTAGDTFVNKLAAVEVDLLGKALVWVKNEAVPETLTEKLTEETFALLGVS